MFCKTPDHTGDMWQGHVLPVKDGKCCGLLSLVESVDVFDDGCQSLSRSLADVSEATDESQQLTT